jgi:hypothetical protein
MSCCHYPIESGGRLWELKRLMREWGQIDKIRIHSLARPSKLGWTFLSSHSEYQASPMPPYLTRLKDINDPEWGVWAAIRVIQVIGS